MGIQTCSYASPVIHDFSSQSRYNPREAFGLFVEEAGVLGNNSLFKMEQRIMRMGVLDRSLLAIMTGGASAGPRGIVASTLKVQPFEHQLQQIAEPPTASLALGEVLRTWPLSQSDTHGSDGILLIPLFFHEGNLPTVTEAPEGEEASSQPMGPQQSQGMMPRDPSVPVAPQPIGAFPGQQMANQMPVPFPVSAQLPGMVPGPGFQPGTWMDPNGMPMGPGMGLIPGGMMPQMQLQQLPDGSIVEVPLPQPLIIPQPRWLDDDGLMVYQPNPLKVSVSSTIKDLK